MNELNELSKTGFVITGGLILIALLLILIVIKRRMSKNSKNQEVSEVINIEDK